MTKWLKKIFHVHEWTEPLIEAVYRDAEYKIRFCKHRNCLACKCVAKKLMMPNVK